MTHRFPELFDSFRLPACGAHAKLTAPKGAGDAAAVTSLVEAARQDKKTVAVICAQPTDVTRLAEEIAWLNPELKVCAFPDWETLPYDTMSPHADLVSERIETLYRLSENESNRQVDVLIATAVTAAQRIAPKSFITGNSFFFKVGESVGTQTLETRLVEAGYGRVEEVVAPGEFCVRGGIVDIYPMGATGPLRLDLFDDEIESIRTFDPETQTSVESVQSIRLLPGHEFAMDEAARNAFRARWRETFSVDPNKCAVYKDVGNGISSPGIEYYLPLFFEETATLSDYLPTDTLIVTVGDVHQALEGFLTETRSRWEFLSHDVERPALPVDTLFQTSTEFFKATGTFARITLSAPEVGIGDNVEIDRKAKDPAAKLKHFIELQRVQKVRTLIVAGSMGRRARLAELLRQGHEEVPEVEDFAEFLSSKHVLAVTQGPLLTGFRLEAADIVVVTENELYCTKATARRSRIKSRHSNVEAMIRDISELRVGDPIVHIEHGVGRYLGLETIDTSEGAAEFLSIEYAADAKLFVPVAQLHLVSRYTGMDAEHAPLHTLGRGDWEKAKKKAAQKARDTAAELLHLYAVRQSRPGFVFDTPMSEYEAFCEGFAFEETPDQAQAIDAVINDMHSGRPMDRLVCGDVGFGKTEVALRAAFIAAMNGKQVAVLCPTTLLAEQHAQTFKDRFAAWPVKVAELSRFRTGKQTTAVIEGLAEGTVDIVIGTHQLLGDKVSFKRLGLVVIDEEHRFGVRQKEKLKTLRANVDILTLTATPIPRTLAMSLDGIRDFSVIATAPQKRLAVKTFVRRETKELIREAVIRELKRAGQVYFLHNDVATIAHRAQTLAELVPEARIAVAHGQMSERELEGVMRDFYRQTYNVLVCTTIIETGIDVPIANTIIMHRADKFGLAQLHQLRGRVGRSHHQAYAYLLTPEDESMTKNALRRLEAIQNLEELGSGFYLAMHDLEIRGAGEVLGDEQSGEMTQVGFDLYNQMLQSAVKSLKNGGETDAAEPFASLTEINLHFPALLPEDYVGDVGARLGLYKRLAAAQDRTQLEEVVDCLMDRFGKLPEAARALIAVHRLRLDCRTIGIRKIDAAETGAVITFDAKPKFDPIKIIELLQSRRDMRMLSGDKLKILTESHTLEDRLRLVRTVVNALLPPVSKE